MENRKELRKKQRLLHIAFHAFGFRMNLMSDIDDNLRSFLACVQFTQKQQTSTVKTEQFSSELYKRLMYDTYEIAKIK
jgi:heme oxygenase